MLNRENKDMLHMIMLLAWPAILEEIFRVVVQYADTAMVGQLGAQASAAVGLTTTVFWLLGSVIGALGTSIVAYISRNIGAGRPREARRASVQAFYIAMAIGIILTILTEVLREKIPVWMNGNEDILEDATAYFAILCATMLFRAFNIIYGSVLRGAGDMKRPMYINAFMNLLNVVLNYIMIYPTRAVSLLGLSVMMPGLGWGVRGAAWATSISMAAGGIMMFVSAQRNPAVSMKGEKITVDRPIMGQLIRLGIPMIAQRVTSCMGYVVFASLVAVLGTIQLAAHSIANQAEGLFYLSGFGIQAAAATLAGNSLGQNDRKKFVRLTKMASALVMFIMAVSGGILFITAPYLMAFFTKDAEVIAMGVTVLRIISVTEPLFGLQTILDGLSNGIGDPKPGFVYSLICMWGVRIFASVMCIFVFGFQLPAVWICMGVDNSLKAVLFTQRFLRGKWKRKFPERAAAI